MSATYVYCIEAADDILYVGHTSNLWRRLRQHKSQPWAGRVTKVRAYVFHRYAHALEVERNMILDLEPEFNVQGNPRYRCCELCHDEIPAPSAKGVGQ